MVSILKADKEVMCEIGEGCFLARISRNYMPNYK